MLFVILESFGTTNSRENRKNQRKILFDQTEKACFRIAFKN